MENIEFAENRNLKENVAQKFKRKEKINIGTEPFAIKDNLHS